MHVYMLLTCSCICLCIVIIALITIRPVELPYVGTLNIFICSVLGYFHAYMHIRYMNTPLYILNAPYVIKFKDTFTQSSNVYNYKFF